jgi:hypothetical protein
MFDIHATGRQISNLPEHNFSTLKKGRVMVQVVSRRIITTKLRIQSQASACEILG